MNFFDQFSSRRIILGAIARMIGGRMQAAIAIIMVLTAVANAQTEKLGELRGRVTSQQTGDPVIGATAMLVGTTHGSNSDLKGTYSIKHVPAGTYTLRISSVGFAAKEITEVKIEGGVQVINVIIEDNAVKGKEIIKTAKRDNGSEAGILNMISKGATVSDGISAAQIKRSGDATAGEALARVTGLSVIGSKFVSVRGTNERYINAQLNGVTLTSTEPDKKAFSFDLFPANLLENTIVSKTFTPDLPGDFTGGLVQLNTTDFPDKQTIRLAVSGGYDPSTTFNSIDLPKRGGTDWLGIDDGLRTLPKDFPTYLGADSLSRAQRYASIHNLPFDWAPEQLSALPNGSFLVSYGDRFNVADNDLGVLATLSYRNNYSADSIVRRDANRYDYAGSESSYSTLWGGLFNVSYKLSDFNTISVRNLYTRTAENQLTHLEGLDSYTLLERKLTGLYYIEREVYSGQVAGEHVLPSLNDLRVQWRGYASRGNRTEPDFRRFGYSRDPFDTTRPFRLSLGLTRNALALGRFYSNLDEDVFGAGGDITVPVENLKFKVGGLVENKTRDFRARSFAYYTSNFEFAFPAGSIDSILAPANVDSGKIEVAEMTAPTDKYFAHQNLNAAYAMLDAPIELLGQRFRAIVGARLEDVAVALKAISSTSERIDQNTSGSDLLPSINLIYQATPEINVRAAYSQTVTRPEFREIAPYTFYDFTTDQLIYGNPDLRRALSKNYDLRFEYFPNPGEIMAVSLFDKDMSDAIESVAITGDVNERTWSNTSKARNSGVELEVRKSFTFISDALNGLSFSANYTWLDSRIEIIGDSLRAGKNGRRMQGQSPYMINAGLYYDDFDMGLSVTLLYNRLGERIIEVGRQASPDFIEQPRDLVDLTVTQTFAGSYEVKLALKNLLGEDRVFTQSGEPARVNFQDMNASLGLSVRF